jgi:hypothetical protein
LLGNIYQFFLLLVYCWGTQPIYFSFQFVVWKHLQLHCVKRKSNYFIRKQN